VPPPPPQYQPVATPGFPPTGTTTPASPTGAQGAFDPLAFDPRIEQGADALIRKTRPAVGAASPVAMASKPAVGTSPVATTPPTTGQPTGQPVSPGAVQAPVSASLLGRMKKFFRIY